MRVAVKRPRPDLDVQSVTAPSVECIPFHCSLFLSVCLGFSKATAPPSGTTDGPRSAGFPMPPSRRGQPSSAVCSILVADDIEL
jgi:hypothetical protein